MSVSTPRDLPSQRRPSLGRWFLDLGWRHIVSIVADFSGFPLVYVLSASLNRRA
jgi:arabinogalactan oligomer/maltooligosaccharide transport system permease protein